MENSAIAKENHEKRSLVDLKEVSAFIVKQMQAGASKPAICQSVIEMGVEKGDAEKLVEELYTKIIESAEEERPTVSSIMMALAGCMLAAMVGGGIWGSMVIITHYELGVVALGMGLLTGYTALLFSKGKRGTPLQTIAVASSIVGIVIGKYIDFFYVLREVVTKEHGAQAAATISVYSGEAISTFIRSIGSMVSGFDVLWIVLAVAAAWSIPKGRGVTLSD
ncbi:MAG TPA: hypothetical protein VE439_03555 [Anaerolineae bacterium]|jgi:hypothetical protein|nr:hypothetical protein [Anaerolineae bacterium]